MTDKDLLVTALGAILLAVVVLGTKDNLKVEAASAKVIASLPGVPVSCMIYIYYPQYMPGAMEVVIKRDRVWAKGHLIYGPENKKIRVKFTEWMKQRRLRPAFNQSIQDLPEELCRLETT